MRTASPLWGTLVSGQDSVSAHGSQSTKRDNGMGCGPSAAWKSPVSGKTLAEHPATEPSARARFAYESPACGKPA